MLNKAFLAKEISELSSSIFETGAKNIELTRDEWRQLVESPEFIARTREQNNQARLATWHGSLADFTQITPLTSNYTTLGVDGSQVYPDKHLLQVNCFLINSGYCLLDYSEHSKAHLDSVPKIFHANNIDYEKTEFLADFVDLKREELEFELAFSKSLEYKKQNPEKLFLCLFDGSLVFWHLENKKFELKNYFLKKYLMWLNRFHEENILIASFLSLPKGRELTNLVRTGASNKICLDFDTISDTDILENLLEQNHRTTVLTSPSKIVDAYPKDLKPHFCYLNAGKEIIRIEFPAWIAQDTTKLDFICSVILDQCVKGDGYPVALAEAHGQAVIKGPDRDLFYHLIYKMGIQQQQRFVISQKNLKKFRMGV